jgi:secreted trypsin-like serine protease
MRRLAISIVALVVGACGLAGSADAVTTGRTWEDPGIESNRVGVSIVNGNPAILNPGAVSLWSPTPNRHRCGGTLIRADLVLTAAHCSSVQQPGLTSVRVGSKDNTAGYFEAGLAAVERHPQYDPVLLIHDIAVLRLAHPVPSTVAIPVEIGGAHPAVGTVGKIYGWGWPCEVGPAPCGVSIAGSLQELGVKITDSSRCPAEWSPATELCFVSGDESHAMACFGDSGTPFFTKDPTQPAGVRLRGVVGYDGDDWNGASCANSAVDNGPGRGVATDVGEASNHDWVIDVMSH